MIEGVLFLKYLLVILFAIFTAKIDFEHIRKHHKILKVSRFFQRAFAIALGGIAPVIDFWLITGLVLTFWLVFNPMLNYMRKLPFFYLSANGIDKLLGSQTLRYKIIYFAAIALVVYSITIK